MSTTVNIPRSLVERNGKLLWLGGALLILGFLYQCHGQGTTRITFDGPPYVPLGTEVFVRSCEEAGVLFTTLGIPSSSNGFSRTGGFRTDRPYDGSRYIQLGLNELTFREVDGSAFSLVSVDLVEYLTVLPGPITVNFLGIRFDGRMVSTNLTTDGINDSIGPLADFQSFYFGPEFSNLRNVQIPTHGWSMDNVVVAVPEPGAWVLLFTGVLMFSLSRTRRNA